MVFNSSSYPAEDTMLIVHQEIKSLLFWQECPNNLEGDKVSKIIFMTLPFDS
jgi:hypothetical protein